MKAFCIALAGAVLIAPLTPALAQTLGVVRAYNAETLRTYRADGSRLSPATPRSDLPPLPTPIVDIQPGGRIGISTGGSEPIYLRGLDIDFELNEAGRELSSCRPVTASNRAAGSVAVGTRAGGGSSTDCIAGGGR